MIEFIKSASLFILAGLCEIGGGYLMWQWLREGKSVWVGLFGAVIIVLYGVIPTLQPGVFTFGRVYAAYGGVFITLSLLWGWAVDKRTPDAPDIIGAIISLVGAAIILYWPRPAM